MADAQELVRKGIEAARDGDKAAARELFEQVLKLDDRDERAWFWMASVVETDEEKRICLSNVIQINPGNERARKVLEQLEAKERQFDGEGEVVPGVSSRQLAIVIGGGVVVILLIVVIFVFATLRQRQMETEAQQQTLVAVSNMTATEVQFQLDNANATATAMAIASPTATVFIPNRATLPPVFTPTPLPTDPVAAEQRGALPFPSGLSGAIGGWSGRDVASVGYLPVGVFNVTTGAFQPVGTKFGRDVRLFPSGQRIAYTRYDELLYSELVETINLNGTEQASISEIWRGWDAVLTPKQPSVSPDGQYLAFIAVDQRETVEQIYVVNLAELPPDANPTTVPSPLRRVTNDSAIYSFPSYSPDGTRLVAVHNDITGASPGEDLVIVDVTSGGVTPLTNDFGSFVETMPRFSPDGTQVIYAAAPSTDSVNFDIIIRAADGSGVPRVIPAMRSSGVDTSPVYSPDGRYVAFASNRNGQFDIFIYDIQTDTLSQLTNSPEPDYPTDWWQSR